MSAYANDISNALDSTLPSIQKLRETLYHVGFRKDYDPIAHNNASFMKITTRFFIYLISLFLVRFPSLSLSLFLKFV